MAVKMILKKLIENSKKFRSDTDLKARAVRGGIWLGAGSGIEQGLRFLRNIILVRLLASEAFGLMAIILAVNNAFESFTQIGIKEAIIQDTKGGKHTYLNGSWWLSFIRSIILFTIAYVSAPWIVKFYNAFELLPMMRLAFFSILFNGIISSKAYIALKRMRYRQWVLISHGSGICGIITAVGLSFLFQNVWALVIGFIVEAGAKCLLSFIICPFKPTLEFEKDSLRALLKYARAMFGLPILYFIFIQADIFVVGKLFSKNELGLYSMAVALAQLPSLLISIFINPILMPAISEIQDKKERINQAIMKTTSLISLLGFPILTFVILYARELLSIIYGVQYMLVAVPFAILFATALLRTCSAPIATVFLSLGHPELHRLFAGVRALLIVIFIYPAIKWFGLLGAAGAGFASMAVSYFFQVIRIRQLTGLDTFQYSTIFLRALFISMPVVVTWVVTFNLFPSQSIINIFPGIVGCLLAYVLSIVIFLRSKIYKFYLCHIK